MSYNTRFIFEAIGTHWEIDLIYNKDEDVLLRKIKDHIEKFDKNYSRFRTDSLISQIAKTPGEYKMPPDFKTLYERYRYLYEKTHGLFTPLIGNVLEDLGYDKDYSFEVKNPHTPENFLDTVSFKNGTLFAKKPVLLDFGAGGKGYLIDEVGEVLMKEGVTEFLIDAGGDMLQKSTAGEVAKIGLENPLNTNQVIGVADVLNMSICGSAGNRRAWKNIHHIINPLTLEPVSEILAVWTIAKSAFIADCMSTVLYLDPSKYSLYPCEYLILYKDLTCDKSSHFPGEIFMQ